MTDRAEVYASHLPVLRALGQHLPIRTVIEYGAGLASTPAFLDRETFPHLATLVSYEESQEWYDRLLEQLPCADDPRWTMKKIILGDFANGAPLPAGADLAFVDTQTADSRVVLLRDLRGRVPVLVLHDYGGQDYGGRRAYRLAARGWPHGVVYQRHRPYTAVLSSQVLPAPLIKALR